MIKVSDVIKAELNRNDGWGDGDTLETFHPSQCGFCLRQMFLSKLKAKDFDEKIIGSMRMGTVIHRYIQSFPLIQEKCDIEVPINYVFNKATGLHFKGNSDLVMKDKTKLFDIKSTKNLFYVKSEPSDEHIRQVNIYMGCLSVPNGSIVYVQKDNLEVKEFEIDFSQGLFNETIDDCLHVYKTLLRWLKIDEPVEMIPYEKCDCYYCNYEQVSMDKINAFRKRWQGQ